MMNFFRRALKTKLGTGVAFVVMGVVALLFGIQGFNLGGSRSTSDDTPVKVGKGGIAANEIRTRTEEVYGNYRQQSPDMTLAQFVARGGLDLTVDSLVDGLAMQQFAASQGMQVSDTYVKGILAGGFKGADGKFSQRLFDEYLAQSRQSYDAIKRDIVLKTLNDQIAAPIVQASQIPNGIALPYASLLLERRDGLVALIPAKAIPAGAAPTDAELATFYRSNVARYTLPERRAIRYAIVSPETLKAQVTPSDAEVAAAYQQQHAKFLPTEKRALTQVVVADQAAATALAAKVKGGTPLADAAKAIGLSAATVKPTDKADYAAQNSPALADAAFGAAKGAVIGPVRGPLGFVVAKVDAVEQIPGKSLDQAKPEIVAALTQFKAVQALGRIHDALDDSLNSKASFGDVVAAQKLIPATTVPLTATGANPDDLAFKLDPKLVPVVAAAFATDPAEGPQLAQIDKDGSFAVVAIDHVVAAAPRPLAQIHDSVARDFVAQRSQAAARAIAAQVVARAAQGMSLDQALAATKLTLPPAQKISASRAQLMAARDRAPPPLVMLFTMPPRTARQFETPDHAAYLVTYLASVTPGNAAGQPKVIASMAGSLKQGVGREYYQQFQHALRDRVGVTRNAAALASLKAALSGQGTPDQP
jgi:peptidyl-prolyl cis-trans isomerase D